MNCWRRSPSTDPVITATPAREATPSDDATLGKSGRKLRQRFFRTRAEDKLPLALTHDRIYILPTRRGWVFLASLLLMLITSMNYALGLGYALCFLLCGLFSSALLATYRNLAGIQLSDALPTSACVGEQAGFRLSLYNPRKHPSSMVRIKNRAGDELTIPYLESLSTETAALNVATHARGWQACGRLTVTSDYPLGLWHSWGYVHVAANTIVFAKPEQDPPELPFSSGDADTLEAQTTMQQAASSGLPDGVREYIPGDSPGSIDWKATARGQSLHTREFATSESPLTLALSWAQTATLENTEARVSRLSAWVLACAKSDIDWTLQMPEQFYTSESAEVDALTPRVALPDSLSTFHGITQPDQHLMNCLQALALVGQPGLEKNLHTEPQDSVKTYRQKKKDGAATVDGAGASV